MVEPEPDERVGLAEDAKHVLVRCALVAEI